MGSENKKNDLEKQLKINVSNIDKAKKEKATILAQTVYLGTLGFVFVLPIILGAYLGSWLDAKLKYFSVAWTLDLIILGVIIGAINVYLLIKE